MPPATYRSPSPARMPAAANMIALRPDPQTRLIVVAGVVSARPARSSAWRAGACPDPAARTCPMMTSSTSGRSPPGPRAPRPRGRRPLPGSTAGTPANAPPNFPIGVRAALTMNAWPLGPLVAARAAGGRSGCSLVELYKGALRVQVGPVSRIAARSLRLRSGRARSFQARSLRLRSARARSGSRIAATWRAHLPSCGASVAWCAITRSPTTGRPSGSGHPARRRPAAAAWQAGRRFAG